MSATGEQPFFLSGLMPRKEFAAKVNRCERTVKRWQDQGKLVVFSIGNERWVDVEKSLARIRGERPPRGRAA
jgi:hypothetical protein